MTHVSLKDIARAAGVSHSTVSRALAGNPLVSEATRARIQALAREMGYSPDTIARSLVTGRTHTIGVVVTTIADPFVAEVVQGIENRAQPAGYSVVLTTSGGEPEREVAAVEMLASKRVDAVIVASSRIGALYLKHLERRRVPIVLVNSHYEQAGPYTFSITVDNRHGGWLATTHLVSLGHRRIAYVSGSPDHSDDLERLAGYRQALTEAGLAVDDALVVPGNGQASGGQRALPQLLALAEPPTAVFCYNDMTAIGLLQALRQPRGERAPRDLAVVGFDDIPYAALFCPALTTIAQPKVEMGERAVEMALDLVAGKGEQQPPDRANVTMQGRLIVRESSGPARAR